MKEKYGKLILQALIDSNGYKCNSILNPYYKTLERDSSGIKCNKYCYFGIEDNKGDRVNICWLCKDRTSSDPASSTKFAKEKMFELLLEEELCK